jgi:DNA helicase-2/ATP-dependent DNA helicase PcrA
LASSVTSSWSGGAVSSRAAQVAEPLPDFKAGMKVFHAKFGEGVIAEVLDKQDDKEIAVEFSRHGKKRLLGSLAKLEVLS